MKSLMFRTLLAFMLALAVPAMAAPGLINYQGRLTNPSGQPITTPVNVIFIFWSAATGGVQLGAFSDTDTVTPDANGVYSTMIGDDPGTPIPASVFNGNSVWLNVRINSEDLAPRKQIVSVGYALRSAHADMATTASRSLVATQADNAHTLDGLDSSAFLQSIPSVTSGIFGQNNSTNGRGIYGFASATTGAAVGVYGQSASTLGFGVYAWATANSGLTHGVYGQSDSTDGLGVYGFATATTGATLGVRGQVNSPDGYAGYFEGRGYFSGNVGIGNANPASRLHVEGSGADVLLVTNTGAGRGATINASNDTAVWANTTNGFAGVDGRNAGTSGRGVYGGATGASGFGGYFTASGDTGRGVFGQATNTGFFENYGGYFTANGIFGQGVHGEGVAYDFYAAGPGVNYGPFTGAHEVQFATGFPAGPKPGLIVVTAGPSKVRRDEKGQVSISSTLPTVRLADRPNAKSVFGVLVREMPLPDDHWYKPAAAERFGAVNALGEGRVWVCSAAGPIEMGDYITTSAVPGYGQKQADDLQHTYTVGKVIESVDWDAVTETIEHAGQVYKVYLIAVVYTCG